MFLVLSLLVLIAFFLPALRWTSTPYPETRPQPEMPTTPRQRGKRRAGLSDDSEDYDDDEEKPWSRRRSRPNTGISHREESSSHSRPLPHASVSLTEPHRDHIFTFAKEINYSFLDLNRIRTSRRKQHPHSYRKHQQIAVHRSAAVGQDFLSLDLTRIRRLAFRSRFLGMSHFLSSGTLELVTTDRHFMKVVQLYNINITVKQSPNSRRNINLTTLSERM